MFAQASVWPRGGVHPPWADSLAGRRPPPPVGAGRQPPAGRHTTAGRHPPVGRHPPGRHTPPGHIPPSPGMATGMHSCFVFFSSDEILPTNYDERSCLRRNIVTLLNFQFSG